MTRSLNAHALFALVAATTLLGIAGTDLVLPAVPSLPQAFASSIERAQMVLAAYALGTLVGLLAFGELGARHDPRRLLIWSLGLFALASIAAIFAPSMEWLIAFRLAQGAFGAGPAVFAPGFIKGLFAEDRAAAAIGRLGSIEALAPALAPIAGAWLLSFGGWPVSFIVLGGLGLVLTLTLAALSHRLPGREEALERHKTYWTILASRRFLRYALSQAFALGGLLVFVFGAPAVITGPLGLGIREFVILQVAGIACFIVGANMSSRLARRFGVERVILAGTTLLAAAFLAMLVYAAAGGTNLVSSRSGLSSISASASAGRSASTRRSWRRKATIRAAPRWSLPASSPPPRPEPRSWRRSSRSVSGRWRSAARSSPRWRRCCWWRSRAAPRRARLQRRAVTPVIARHLRFGFPALHQPLR